MTLHSPCNVQRHLRSTPSLWTTALPHAHTSLGVLHMWQKQLPQAIAEAERAIALDPNFAEGFSILGNIMIFAGRPQEAIALVEKAIRLNPRQVGPFTTSLPLAYRDA